jgi:uncharacterized protein with HEPN domain
MTQRDYGDYIQDIAESIEDIENFVRGMTYTDFINDRKTFNAVVRSIEIIGEAAKNIPAIIRGRYPSLPWKKMSGMRDKLVHEYFGIDSEIVWKTINDDLPRLKLLLKDITKEAFEQDS